MSGAVEDPGRRPDRLLRGRRTPGLSPGRPGGRLAGDRRRGGPVRGAPGRDEPSRRHHVARLPVGGLVPTSTAIGAWQLILVPLPDTELRGLSRRHLSLLERHVRLGIVADEGRRCGRGPPRRSWSRGGPGAGHHRRRAAPWPGARERPPCPDGRSSHWRRERPHLHRRCLVAAQRRRAVAAQRRWPGRDVGERELLLVAERDWVVAESPCAVENHGSWDLLVSGQLRSAVDQHVARLLRMVETRIEEADAALLDAVERRRQTDAAVLAAAARRSIGVIGAGAALPVPDGEAGFDRYGRAAAVVRWSPRDGQSDQRAGRP
ncbi:hypothetical protein NKG94_01945 [Micromonospora sp. M12]